MEREEMIAKLRNMLDEERFEHSLGVEKTAVELAKLHGVDPRQAAIAGLLHDSAKDVKNDPEGFCKQYGIEGCLSEYRELPLPVLHAPVAGHLVRKEFGVDDPEICSAIACHTGGKTGMSDLDKVIYLADYTEPGRGNDPRVEQVRRLAREDLDRALLQAMENTIDHLRGQGKQMHPATLEAYNELAKKLGRKPIDG